MQNTSSAFLDKYLTPIAVILGACIIAFALMFARPGMEREGANDLNNPAVDVSMIENTGEPFIGNPEAPAVIAVYNDFQCPFCKQFDLEVLPQIKAKYVDTGMARVMFKDFQFLGQDSMDTAVYGRAVWEAHPDLYYAWFTAVMKAQDQGGDQGFGDLASNRALAATIPGIDTARVDQLVEQKRAQYEAAIEGDRDEGAALGINGTPSVIVGSQLLSGMAPEDFFAEISREVDRVVASE